MNNTTENNKMIAAFMGYRYETGVSLGGSWSRFFKIEGEFKDSFPKCKYHTSWDWLMPVVEKIEDIGFYVTIEQNLVTVYDKQETYNWYGGRMSDNKLISTYIAVTEFIKWYNLKSLNPQ